MSRFLGLFVLLAFIGFISYKSMGVILAFDSFCHLQTGLDMIERGLSPYRDHYSFTHAGSEIFAPPVVFQIMLAWLHQGFGTIAGFQLYKAFFFSLTLLAIYAHMVKQRTHWSIAMIVTPWASLMMFERCLVRPEVVSNLFLVASFFLFFMAKRDFCPKNLVFILFYQLIWVNYHVHSSVYGFVVFGALYIEHGIRLFVARHGRQSDWYIWAGLGTATFLVGFLNPFLSHPIIAGLAFDPAWKTLIGEYLPPYRYVNYPFALLYAALIIMLVPALLAKREFGMAIIVGVLNVYAMKMTRILQPAAFASFVILIYFVSRVDIKSTWASFHNTFKRCATVVFALVLGVLLWESGSRAIRVTPTSVLSAYRFPVDVADFMAEKAVKGNVINEYRIGSYLIHRLFPNCFVYIDGRSNVLYPLEFVDRHTLIESSAPALLEDAEKYNVEYLIFPDRGERFDVIQETGLFGIHFAGFRYVLFARHEPNFPVSGSLLIDPQSWSDDFPDELKREIRLSRSILPENSLLLPILRFLDAYANAEDKDRFLTRPNRSLLSSDYVCRLAASMAEKRGHFKAAIQYNGLINNKKLGDFLNTARQFVSIQRYREAEGILFLAFGDRPLSSEEKAKLHGALRPIKSKGGLDFFSTELWNSLEAAHESGDTAAEEVNQPSPQ